MIDCGEGTQMQLRRSHLRFTKINHIFISHHHGDHCFGLIGMISSFGMLGRTAPLHIYATAEYSDILHREIDFFCNGLEFEIVFHPIDTTQNKIIYEDRSLTVTTLPLKHRVPCCGFLFQEKPTLPHIRRDLVDMYAIPLSQINNIKNGQSWTSPEGEVITSEQLTTPPDPSRSYAYCSDTLYQPGLSKLIDGVSTLYHESTYTEKDADRARTYHHSTARQAAMVAQKAHAGKLIIGHFSARYEDENELLEEAKKTFEKTYLAKEMIVFDV